MLEALAMSIKKFPPSTQSSKVIGLYQLILRRNLEHFFPDAMLSPAGDRSTIRLARPRGANYELEDDAEAFGLELEWLKTRYHLRPGAPVPFTVSERRLVGAGLDVLDRRFRSIYEPGSQLEDVLQYAVEDQTVARYLDTPHTHRIPPALEALRVAAMSTYENRRSSTGVLLLGGDRDPAAPSRANPPGAPRYDMHLAALKSIHRICDGLNTVFLVDTRGDLAWPIDIGRWAEQVQGPEPLPAPCPRPYLAHARATLSGGHVALVLSHAQEIKVLAHGQLTFAFSDGRWRLLDIATKYEAWRQAVGPTRPADLADRVFRAALNLAEQRRGALFVVLRDPAASLPQLVAPEDRILDEIVADDPEDPDNVAPRLAKRALHHLAHAQDLKDMDDTVIEALAGIDGAVVTDADGRLLSFGAILRVTAETILAPRAVQGARTTAALAASYHGAVLKVSEDGGLTMFLGGRRVMEF
jgi:DNA integrity scanning protein DisA with diadenylate cyclase activity